MLHHADSILGLALRPHGGVEVHPADSGILGSADAVHIEELVGIEGLPLIEAQRVEPCASPS